MIRKYQFLWFLKTHKTNLQDPIHKLRNWKEIKNHQFFIIGGQHIIVATLVSLKGYNFFFDLIRYLISHPIFNTTKIIEQIWNENRLAAAKWFQIVNYQKCLAATKRFPTWNVENTWQLPRDSQHMMWRTPNNRNATPNVHYGECLVVVRWFSMDKILCKTPNSHQGLLKDYLLFCILEKPWWLLRTSHFKFVG
jgi:hypothetical protein